VSYEEYRLADAEILEQMKDRYIVSKPLKVGTDFVDNEIEKLLTLGRELIELNDQVMRVNIPAELTSSLLDAKKVAARDALYQLASLVRHVEIHHKVRRDSRRRQLHCTLEYRKYREAARKKKESAV